MFAPTLRQQADYERHSIEDSVDTDAAYNAAMQASWVYADITLIAARVASEQWEVKRRSGEELLDKANHPFERLWQEPGGTYPGGLLAQYTIWWYLLRGNAYLFVATDAPGRGEPRELWPLVSKWMHPRPETLRKSMVTGKPIIDYEYRLPNTGGHGIMLPGENVVHFRTPNPNDYWQGLSPLVAAMDGITLDLGARRWQRDFYREDNAIPTAVIAFPSDMTQTDFERITGQIGEDIKAGKRMFFGRGEMSVNTVQQTMTDMQFVETRAFTREEIDNIYHVPTGLLTGGNSGDAQQAQEITFARNCIQPLLDYMAAELTMRVAPYYGEDVMIVAPDVVPQDRAIAIQEYTTYGADRTVNENRAELGLDPWVMPEEAAAVLGMDVDALANVPTRLVTLLGRAQSSQLAAAFAPGNVGELTQEEQEEIEGGEEPGNLPGAQAPAQAVETLAEKAARLGIETEMGRWQKVALREVRDGRAA
jgi:HK97 family phage portal protein